MIMDNQAAFCIAQAITTTAYSSNAGYGNLGYIDQGPQDAFLGNGTAKLGVDAQDLNLVILLTSTMADANSPRQYTVIPTLETADDAAFTSNLTTLMTFGTFAAGSLAKTKQVWTLPFFVDYRRYLRMKFTTSGTLTGGAFSAFLVMTPQALQIYPGRLSILPG